MIRLDRIGKSNGATVHEYTERDVILYHLGIGAGAGDLDLVYEGVNGGLKVCPTYAVVPMLEPLMKLLPQFNVPFRSILHGEQVIFLDRPIPPRGTLITTARVPAGTAPAGVRYRSSRLSCCRAVALMWPSWLSGTRSATVAGPGGEAGGLEKLTSIGGRAALRGHRKCLLSDKGRLTCPLKVVRQPGGCQARRTPTKFGDCGSGRVTAPHLPEALTRDRAFATQYLASVSGYSEIP